MKHVIVVYLERALVSLDICSRYLGRYLGIFAVKIWIILDVSIYLQFYSFTRLLKRRLHSTWCGTIFLGQPHRSPFEISTYVVVIMSCHPLLF